MHRHELFEQICPARHALPHAPQLRESLVKSAHPEPHACVPGPHTTPNFGQPQNSTTTTLNPNDARIITTSFQALRPT
jgi:hypothetical protein